MSPAKHGLPLLRDSLYTLGRTTVRLYAFLRFHVDLEWQAPLPAGPKLIVANHPSCTDPFLLLLLSRKPVSIMITGNAFDVPLFSALLRHGGQIEVIPGNGRQALAEALRRLEAGGAVAIFPEGHTSPQEGGYLSPRPGAARLALGTGAAVIPVGIYLPRQRSICINSKISGGKPTTGYWYLQGPYAVTVGAPLRFAGDVSDPQQVETVSAEIMAQIALLADESEGRTLARTRLALPAKRVMA